MIDKSRMLKALQARLLLEQDLGTDYAPGLIDLRPSLLPPVTSSPLSSSPLRANPGAAPARRHPAREHAAVPEVAPPPSRDSADPVPSRRRGPAAVPLPASACPANPEKEEALRALREEAMACTRCDLCAKRTTVVWGEGSLDATVMFIGEGPGRDEDREGRPFVGRSGRVLTDIIEKGMRVPRDGVYIANVVKCRPPGNREPRPDEVAACARYLERQIEVIQPRVIVAVGGVAGCALMQLPPRTSGLRGRWHHYHGVPLRVIFHPSYLLRQRGHDGERTDADRATWHDILEVMKKLEETPEAGSARS